MDYAKIFNSKNLKLFNHCYGNNKDYLNKVDGCFNLVLQFFNNDETKTKLWFNTRNPFLAEFKPVEFFLLGKVDRVFSFINSQIDLNSME